VKAGSYDAKKPPTVDLPSMLIAVLANARRDARADLSPQAASDATFPT
jgi:hypothetical protein